MIERRSRGRAVAALAAAVWAASRGLAAAGQAMGLAPAGAFQPAPAAWGRAMRQVSSLLSAEGGGALREQFPDLALSLARLDPDAPVGLETLGPLSRRAREGFAARLQGIAGLGVQEQAALLKSLEELRLRARLSAERALLRMVAQAKQSDATSVHWSSVASRVEKAADFYGGDALSAVRAVARREVEAARLRQVAAQAQLLLADIWDAEPLEDAAAVGSATHEPPFMRALDGGRWLDESSGEPRRTRPGTKPVRSAVVLGAGPGGLMTAINLVKHGADVVLVEQRDGYERAIHFNVRQALLDQLAFYDPVLAREVLAKAGRITRREVVDATLEERASKEVPDPRLPSGRMRRVGARFVLEAPSVYQIKVSDLEEILYRWLKLQEERGARGRGPRVRVLRGVQADLDDRGEGRYGVRVQGVKASKAADGRSARERVGEPEDLGVPDLVVVAEGANSLTREALGIERSPASSRAGFVAASLNLSLGGLSRVRYDEVEDPETGERHRVRQVTVGHSKSDATWTVVEVPPFIKLDTPEIVRSYFLEWASKVLEKSVEEVVSAGFAWTPRQFHLQQWITASAIAGANVILIGDAVGNAHFLTSGGVMTASVPHQVALEQLLYRCATKAGAWTEAMAGYSRRVRAATLEWLRLGSREFNDAPERFDVGRYLPRTYQE